MDAVVIGSYWLLAVGCAAMALFLWTVAAYGIHKHLRTHASTNNPVDVKLRQLKAVYSIAYISMFALLLTMSTVLIVLGATVGNAVPYWAIVVLLLQFAVAVLLFIVYMVASRRHSRLNRTHQHR